jgi:hypothetical protein
LGCQFFFSFLLVGVFTFWIKSVFSKVRFVFLQLLRFLFVCICVSCVIYLFIYLLPVVLYGCETWSLTLREKRRLRVFENRVLRIFGPKRDEVKWEWR